MKKILILSTDTLHHRYFINKIVDADIHIDKCFFETESVKPKFQTGPLYEKLQNQFEQMTFSKKDLKKVQVQNVKTMDSSEAIYEIKKYNPDLGIAFGTRKLPAELIDVFKDGLINVHRGISEEYRGLDSELWAIYHKDYENIGTTIHMINSDLDTGNIISQEKFVLKKNMKIHQLRYYTTKIATTLIINAIKQYIKGDLQSKPQKKKGRYYSFMPLELKKMVSKKFNKYCEKL